MTAKRAFGMPPPMPRTRAPAATPAPAIQEAIAQMPHVEYSDEATEIDGPHVAQKKWLDSIETIPFDPSMRVGTSDLCEGTPPRAVPPVRVEGTPRPAARRGQTPRPAPRPPARHPHDNAITRLTHVDVAGGHVSFSPDPDQAPPLPSIPTPAPSSRPMLHAPYGAPALPPHAPTAMALPPQAVMPTQIAQPLPAALPTQIAHALPALVRPYQDGVTPYPVPPWATGQHALPHVAQSAAQSRGYAIPPNHLDIYADTDERRGETMRVSALPPGGVPSVRPSISRYLFPMIGATAIIVFVAGYFIVSGGTSKAPQSAPVASTAVMPVAKAPVVSEIVEPQLPDPSWKPRAAEPTIVAAKAEPIAVAPVAAEPVVEEIEMAATPIAKPAKKSSSSARRAKRAQVAAIEMPKAKPAKAVRIEKAAKTTKPEKVIAKSTKTQRDPILEEIEKPTKTAVKATGPGKLAISTSVPTLIYVDGRSTNLMTPKTLNLTAGTHKITLLELKSRKAKTFDIEVASGTIAKLDKKF